MCSTTSPCGEKIPGAGRSPEYYLLLEASNMLASDIDKILYMFVCMCISGHIFIHMYVHNMHYRMVGNNTYCALSVQFMIKLHGLSMGGITTVVSLIVSKLLSLSPLSHSTLLPFPLHVCMYVHTHTHTHTDVPDTMQSRCTAHVCGMALSSQVPILCRHRSGQMEQLLA